MDELNKKYHNRLKSSLKSNCLIGFLFVVLFLIVSSCSDFLEQLPDQRTELDSAEKIAELLTSAYPRASYITFLEAMSDNAEDKGLAQADPINREAWLFNDVPGRDQDTPVFYWQAAYAAIAASNHALEAIANATDKQERYAALRGEALVARAYAHFMLVTLFSRVYDPATATEDPGIPYVTEPEKKVITGYERKTVAYVYDQIEKDLTEGVPLIDDELYAKGAPAYHFTKAAAHAFASRFYLFKRDYRQVVEHADRVFSGSTFNYLRPLNSPAYRALEPLAKQAEYTKASQSSNLLLVEASSLWARSLRGHRYGFSYNLLEQMFWAANATGGQWTYMFYGNEESLFTPKFKEHFVRQDPNANIGLPYTMIPLLTTEEVLFNRAEANVKLGNYDAALEDLNAFVETRVITNDVDKPYFDPSLHRLTQVKIRDFYRTADTETAMLSAVLDFKRGEFVFEGLRWLDIIRHGLPVVHTSFDKRTKLVMGPNDPRRVIQIPQEAELSGLERNPR